MRVLVAMLGQADVLQDSEQRGDSAVSERVI